MKTNYIKLIDGSKITESTLNECGTKTQSITISGRITKWSMIDIACGYFSDGLSAYLAIFGLFESDTYGDLTDYAVCFLDWYSGDNNWKEIDGTYDDLFTALRDFGVI